MMKSRLSSSVSTLLSGMQRRTFSKAISISSSNILFYGKCRSWSSFQYQGFEALRRAVHNFSSEDDFSELGPPVAGSAATKLKLMTEKPEPFVKTNTGGKASANMHIIRDIFVCLEKTSQTSNQKLHNHHDFSRKNSLTVDSSSCPKSNENVLDGLDCCEVESENSESSVRDPPNHPLHAVKKVTIRIQGIGEETTDPMIHSICKSIGALEGFARADKDSVDALFRVANGSDVQVILERLNNTVIGDFHWSAYHIQRDSPSTTLSVSEEVRNKLALQINSGLFEFKKQLDFKRIYFEDLEYLHMGIMHLEGLPTTNIPLHED